MFYNIIIVTFGFSFFNKFGFPGCLGCIDGTHVALIKPNEHEAVPHTLVNVHCLTRNTVERCIGVLKARCRCLLAHRVLHYDHHTVTRMINACAVLHNICNKHWLPVPQLPSADTQQDQQHQIPRQSLQDAGSTAGGEQDLLASGRQQRNRIVQRLWSTRSN